MLKVRPKMLLLFAAAVWLAAGMGVASTGVASSSTAWVAAMGGAAAIVYLLFLIMFLMIARKHIRRIRGYSENLVSMFSFFDAPSYIVLAVMVGLGAAVRFSGLVPGTIIAPFYSGLGMALITTAIYYAATFIAICDELVAR
ncbi:MAG: hypothetical protein LBP28_06940 [Coriobacteriales bacterium]|nr:hypothetical protein [Coriobacteriales bacterium]